MTDTMIKKAVELLREGKLVAFPTETVYGLGADANNAVAVQTVFAVKNRPAEHPLIVHLGDAAQLSQWAAHVTLAVQKLAEAFWPGPLTMIVKKSATVLDVVTGGQDTVAIRVPAHPTAQRLLQAFGGGLVGPSANIFSRLSPTTAAAVVDELGEQVDMILDGGECEVGLESTIIDLSQDGNDQPVILRPGIITIADIENVLHTAVLKPDGHTRRSSVRAPGMHAVHYAPRTKVLLVEPEKLNKLVQEYSSNNKSFAVLARNDIKHNPYGPNNLYVTMPKGAREYGHLLYSTLRSVDHHGCECILVEMVPDEAPWSAIRDRLMKASAEQ